MRLAKSDNPHEAALAMSRAQEIMDRHKLTNLSLDMDTENPDEEIRNFGFDPVDMSYATWKGRLIMSLARHNQCKSYKCHYQWGKAGLALIGRSSDVTTVRYLYGWMVREIDRLAEAQCAGTGRSYWNNFRIGAVESVVERLREAREATFQEAQREAAMQPNPMAMVRVQNAITKMDARMDAVNVWQKKNFKLVSTSRSSIIHNPSAREAGREAGKTISLRPSAGGLTNRCAQLKG